MSIYHSFVSGPNGFPKRNSERGGISTGLIVLIALIVIVLGGIGVLISGYSYGNKQKGIAVGKETQLSSDVRIAQLNLSNHEQTAVEGFDVTDAQKDALKEQLIAIVQAPPSAGDGRTLLVNMARQTNPWPNEPLNRQQALFEKLYDDIKQTRIEWNNQQKLISDRASQFERWIHEDTFREWWLTSGPFFTHIPDNNLKMNVGDKTYYAAEALDKMEHMVVTGSTTKAYDTGTYDGFQHKKDAAPAQK